MRPDTPERWGGLSPQCDNDAISAAARARKRVTLHCAHCDPTQKPATLILYGFGWDLPRRRRCRGLAVVVVRSVTGEGVFTVREYHRRDFISSSSSISRWWLTHDTCIWFWMLVSHLCVCMCGIFAPVWPLTKKKSDYHQPFDTLLCPLTHRPLGSGSYVCLSRWNFWTSWSWCCDGVCVLALPSPRRPSVASGRRCRPPSRT
jgi:hypothetical protein